MSELTAVREVQSSHASDNGASRPLTINDIDNFAALLKGASAEGKGNSANSILPEMEIVDGDAPVSRCGKPSQDKVVKCFSYEGQPERKESGAKSKVADQDEIKIHRPMLNEEPKIHRPMLDDEIKIRRPMLDESRK